MNSTTSIASVSATSDVDTDIIFEEKIKKLARLTQQGTVEWKTVDASAIPTLSFARVLTAYEASFGGERLRLIETGYEKRNLFASLGGLSSMFPTMRTNEMDSIVLSLHLLDRNGRPTFKFPNVAAIYDLLSEIKMRQSDIVGFLKAIDAAEEQSSN